MKFKQLIYTIIIFTFLFSGCGNSDSKILELELPEIPRIETTTEETTIEETTTEETTIEETTIEETTIEETTIEETTTETTTIAMSNTNYDSDSDNSAIEEVDDFDDDSSQTVYIGATGNKYHRESCSTLKGKGRAISKSQAENQGRTPCKRCKP